MHATWMKLHCARNAVRRNVPADDESQQHSTLIASFVDRLSSFLYNVITVISVYHPLTDILL